jgi:hypothetical protein
MASASQRTLCLFPLTMSPHGRCWRAMPRNRFPPSLPVGAAAVQSYSSSSPSSRVSATLNCRPSRSSARPATQCPLYPTQPVPGSLSLALKPAHQPHNRPTYLCSGGLGLPRGWRCCWRSNSCSRGAFFQPPSLPVALGALPCLHGFLPIFEHGRASRTRGNIRTGSPRGSPGPSAPWSMVTARAHAARSP